VEVMQRTSQWRKAGEIGKEAAHITPSLQLHSNLKGIKKGFSGVTHSWWK